MSSLGSLQLLVLRYGHESDSKQVFCQLQASLVLTQGERNAHPAQ